MPTLQDRPEAAPWPPPEWPDAACAEEPAAVATCARCSCLRWCLQVSTADASPALGVRAGLEDRRRLQVRRRVARAMGVAPAQLTAEHTWRADVSGLLADAVVGEPPELGARWRAWRRER